MEKINIAELLRNCPRGMELDCTMFDDVKFIAVDEAEKPICIRTGKAYRFLTEFGTWTFDENAKCVIFPKGKTSWEGFVPNCQFKDGDIAVSDKGDIHLLRTEDSSYCAYRVLWRGLAQFDKTITTSVRVERLATEKEKEKFFQAIKDNGYRWNEETKTLDELPKFKVGDRIRLKANHNYIYTITSIREKENKYVCSVTFLLRFSEQDNWELVPDKFDITSLKPFDKVLVRMDNKHVWEIQFFERLNTILKDSFVCMGRERYHQCIPYDGNEHLLNTAKDCEDYFKTWE